MIKVLSIAGSDPSGGAGIAADIKTITVHGAYAMHALTALTAQNTVGVFAIHHLPPEFIGAQLDAIFKDIYPDAIKIGMLPQAKGIALIGEKLLLYKGRNIVLDPVMITSSGTNLLSEDSLFALRNILIPASHLITPNIPEAEVLSRVSIRNKTDMKTAAIKLNETYGIAVLLKGGHLTDTADDLLCVNRELHWFEGSKIINHNNHGTGCTLSSAIACHLGKGEDLFFAIKNAKLFVRQALNTDLNLGKGSGPLNHMFNI